MKIARYEAHRTIHFGVVDEENENVTALDGDIFGEHTLTDHVHKLHPMSSCWRRSSQARSWPWVLTTPVTSGTGPPPNTPWVFHKTPTSVIGPEDTIIRPKEVQRFDAEGEMVVVIKDTCSYVSKADALNHVLGYTCGNDVSARDWQRKDRNENNSDWWRAKSADTFSPMGPWIETDADPAARPVAANPSQRQRGAGPEHQTTCCSTCRP